MSTRTRAAVLWGGIVALTAMGATAGCGPRDSDRERQAADGALRVSEITLGKRIGGDNRVIERTSDFNPRDTIYAAIETDRSATGGTLAVRWTFEDGQVVDESTRTIAPDAPTVTAFHIVNPDGWPTGRYRVEAVVNGTAVRSEDFQVR